MALISLYPRHALFTFASRLSNCQLSVVLSFRPVPSVASRRFALRVCRSLSVRDVRKVGVFLPRARISVPFITDTTPPRVIIRSLDRSRLLDRSFDRAFVLLCSRSNVPRYPRSAAHCNAQRLFHRFASALLAIDDRDSGSSSLSVITTSVSGSSRCLVFVIRDIYVTSAADYLVVTDVLIASSSTSSPSTSILRSFFPSHSSHLSCSVKQVLSFNLDWILEQRLVIRRSAILRHPCACFRILCVFCICENIRVKCLHKF